MKKIEKILMIGLGSIGQRHLKNIRQIDSSIKVYAYRQRNNDVVINDLQVQKTYKSVKEYYELEKEYADLEEALTDNYYDIVFICNLSSQHLKTALRVASEKFNMFIEKPLSHNSTDLNKLNNIIESNNLVCVVGYQMRFHPGILYIKNNINKEDIISVQISHGSYMPSWHNWESYNDLYCSKKALGGGVVLSQIHEIDYLLWLFGDIQEVYAVGGHYSDLDIDVEDNVDALFAIENQKYNINLHLDFLQKKTERYIKIITKKTTYDINLIENTIGIEGKCSHYFHNQHKTLFIEQTHKVMESVRQNKVLNPLASVKDGINSLEVALKIKERISL